MKRKVFWNFWELFPYCLNWGKYLPSLDIDLHNYFLIYIKHKNYCEEFSKYLEFSVFIFSLLLSLHIFVCNFSVNIFANLHENYFFCCILFWCYFVYLDSFPQLERLCNLTVEQNFESKAVVIETNSKVRNVIFYM